MKRIITPLVVFIALYGFSSCQSSEMEENFTQKENTSTGTDSQTITNPTPITKEEVKQKAITFFQKNLNTEKLEDYTESSEIPLTMAEDYQKIIWQAWKEANQMSGEEKLPPLSPLENTTPSRWILPAKLEANAVLRYYWGAKGNRPTSGFPLFIYLHGSGDKNQEWNTGYALARAFKDAPSVYFIPQIPNTGDYYRWWQKAKQYAWKKLLRQTLISDEINPNKIYVFGISEGGYGSQRLASFYADYWAGAGPMAGGEPLINAPVENCSNLAFNFRTGALDSGFSRNKLTQYTKDEFEKWQAKYPSYFTHHIELIPGRGHGIDYYTTTPWLRNYQRNPYPKQLWWENFEMDGMYRDAFYNLQVLERSNADNRSRTFYQMDIEGNEVRLQVSQVTYKATETNPTWGFAMRFEKTFIPAKRGKFRVYLNQDLVDLNREVTLIVNGVQVAKKVLTPDIRHMINSSTVFFDPKRVYPVAIDIDLEHL